MFLGILQFFKWENIYFGYREVVICGEGGFVCKIMNIVNFSGYRKIFDDIRKFYFYMKI